MIKSHAEVKRESRKFPQPFFFSIFFVYFLWSACFFFFRYLQLLLLHPYSSPLCSCNLDRWSESSLLLCSFRFDVYHFFYCCLWSFAERFSFVESFEIQSSNLWNDVTRMKCWMKPRVDQSNMKILLDEPENVVWNICSRSNFHSTRFFFIEHFFFFLFLRSVKPVRHFIEHGIFVMLDEMLDRFNKAFRKFLNIHRKKIDVEVSL